MKEAGVAPAGVMPIQQPISADRTARNQCRGRAAQVRSTTFRSIFARCPRNLSPSSIEDRISLMPNRPMTATRKSKPRIISVLPKVIRSWPVTVSMPTAASRKPSVIAAMVFSGGPRLMPTKQAKERNITAKNSGGPKRSAKPATTGATKVIITTATRAPKKEEVKAAVSASPARPCCAIG
jgi:hypothetical protein